MPVQVRSYSQTFPNDSNTQAFPPLAHSSVCGKYHKTKDKQTANPLQKLLLQDLLKHTPGTHPDHPLLVKAKGLVEQVADMLDKDLQDNEQRQRYMELSMATGAVVGTAVIRAIPLTLLLRSSKELASSPQETGAGRGGGDHRNIWHSGGDRLNILLFNDILVPFPSSKLSKIGGEKWLNHKRAVIARPENQWPPELVWLTDIEQTGIYFVWSYLFLLTRVCVAEKDKNNFKFQITGPGRSFVVVTKSLEDKQNWWNFLTEAITGNINTQQNDVNKFIGTKRWGSYQFKNKIRYTGEWSTGNVSWYNAFLTY